MSVLPSVGHHCVPFSVNRKLAAVTSFYEFRARHGVEVARLLVGMQPAGRRPVRGDVVQAVPAAACHHRQAATPSDDQAQGGAAAARGPHGS
jgi:hypothetical protein